MSKELKPLTVEQIYKLYAQFGKYPLTFATAIEHAHGIKGTNDHIIREE